MVFQVGWAQASGGEGQVLSLESWVGDRWCQLIKRDAGSHSPSLLPPCSSAFQGHLDLLKLCLQPIQGTIMSLVSFEGVAELLHIRRHLIPLLGMH